MKTQELNREEMQAINGGFLGIGDDNSRLTSVLAANFHYSHTDEDGQTESSNFGFDVGSLTESIND
jgi:hypothetical protein